MRSILTCLIKALVLTMFAVAATYAAIDNSVKVPDLAQPGLNLAPEDVVAVVIQALANNDDPYPDAGIETTFRFASPQNRANTGPLERFSQMVKRYPYRDMVDHRQSDLSEVVFVGENAYLVVKLIVQDGREVAYAFRLSRQSEGRYRGMWMTDAVWPVNQ